MTSPLLRPAGLAVIGAGLAWAPHRESLRSLAGEVDVRWMVGRSLERVRKEALHFPGARVSASIEDVLNDREVRVALVLTPPNAHPDIVRRLAAHGIHVLVEKPLATDMAQARELVANCRRAGVTLGVVLQHRMRPASRRLKALLDAGELGVPTTAAVDIRWWRPQSYYDEPGRGTWARDGGGVLLTQAIHTLDLFLHLAGPPAQACALAATSAAHRMECEDTVAAAVRMRSGCLAAIHATTAAYPGFAAQISLSGTLGTATLIGDELSVHWHDGRRERSGSDEQMGAGADPMAFAHDAHCALLRDFLQAASRGTRPVADGADGLAVQEFIDALLASSRSGRCVDLGEAGEAA